MYSAFAESVGFAPQPIQNTQLEATNIKSSVCSWRNVSLRSHWNIFSFADVDTLKFKVIFKSRRKVEACDMSLAGRDDYDSCCKHEQCGTRLKVWQSNEFGVKGVTCLYSVSPQNSSVASGQKKWESVVRLFSSGCEISACRLFDNVPATFWNLHVPSCTCSVELTSNSDVTGNKLLKKWPIVMTNTLCRQKSKYQTMPGVSFWSTN